MNNQNILTAAPDHIADARNMVAAAVQGEPVAWQLRTPEGRVILNKEFPGWAAGGDGYKITPLYTAPQPAEQQPVPALSNDDHVSIPRGLIAAACSAIDKKRDAENVLSELRRYTLGDLSRQTEPDVAQLVEALEGLLAIVDETDGVSGYVLYGEIAEWSLFGQVEMAREALASYRQQVGDV